MNVNRPKWQTLPVLVGNSGGILFPPTSEYFFCFDSNSAANDDPKIEWVVNRKGLKVIRHGYGPSSQSAAASSVKILKSDSNSPTAVQTSTHSIKSNRPPPTTVIDNRKIVTKEISEFKSSNALSDQEKDVLDTIEGDSDSESSKSIDIIVSGVALTKPSVEAASISNTLPQADKKVNEVSEVQGTVDCFYDQTDGIIRWSLEGLVGSTAESMSSSSPSDRYIKCQYDKSSKKISFKQTQDEKTDADKSDASKMVWKVLYFDPKLNKTSWTRSSSNFCHTCFYNSGSGKMQWNPPPPSAVIYTHDGKVWTDDDGQKKDEKPVDDGKMTTETDDGKGQSNNKRSDEFSERVNLMQQQINEMTKKLTASGILNNSNGKMMMRRRKKKDDDIEAMLACDPADLMKDDVYENDFEDDDDDDDDDSLLTANDDVDVPVNVAISDEAVEDCLLGDEVEVKLVPKGSFSLVATGVSWQQQVNNSNNKQDEVIIDDDEEEKGIPAAVDNDELVGLIQLEEMMKNDVTKDWEYILRDGNSTLFLRLVNIARHDDDVDITDHDVQVSLSVCRIFLSAYNLCPACLRDLTDVDNDNGRIIIVGLMKEARFMLSYASTTDVNRQVIYFSWVHLCYILLSLNLEISSFGRLDNNNCLRLDDDEEELTKSLLKIIQYEDGDIQLVSSATVGLLLVLSSSASSNGSTRRWTPMDILEYACRLNVCQLLYASIVKLISDESQLTTGGPQTGDEEMINYVCIGSMIVIITVAGRLNLKLDDSCEDFSVMSVLISSLPVKDLVDIILKNLIDLPSFHRLRYQCILLVDVVIKSTFWLLGLASSNLPAYACMYRKDDLLTALECVANIGSCNQTMPREIVKTAISVAANACDLIDEAEAVLEKGKQKKQLVSFL